jgi:tetratricopeptide (TPR) repeat protein
MSAVGLRIVLLTMFAGVAFGETFDDAESQMQKGDQLYDQGKYDAAALHYDAARILAPTKPGPYLWLGMAYAMAGRCSEAVPQLERYIQMRSDNPRQEAVTKLAECKRTLLPPVQPVTVGSEESPSDRSEEPAQVNRRLVKKNGWIAGVVVGVVVVVGVALGVGLGVGLTKTSQALDPVLP